MSKQAGSAAYFFTRFPVASETFLQRELRAMRRLGAEIVAYSLWGGADSFEGERIRRMRPRDALSLFWKLPYWLLRKPRAYVEMLGEMLDTPPPSLLNVAENLWGLCAGTLLAGECVKQSHTRIHAVWASMPATAAWLVWRLTGLPYSFGAHAYDLFEHGGDWLLELKLRDAVLVHTTTSPARERILRAGASPEKVKLIPRGLDHIPQVEKSPRLRSPLRILSVGRLVEKKGFADQLRIYRALQDSEISFEARIIGDGPLRAALESDVEKLGLGENVCLIGACAFREVAQALHWADIFIFTGKVAQNGDRDGFPNVVGESMAAGTPVICSYVGGLPDVIVNGENGILLNNSSPEEWVQKIVELQRDDILYHKLSQNGQAWAAKNFDAMKNAQALMEAQEQAAHANVAKADELIIG